jgi:hypothetical protein
MRSFRRIIFVFAAALWMLCGVIAPASPTVADDRTLILAGAKIYTSPHGLPDSEWRFAAARRKNCRRRENGRSRTPRGRQKTRLRGPSDHCWIPEQPRAFHRAKMGRRRASARREALATARGYANEIRSYSRAGPVLVSGKHRGFAATHRIGRNRRPADTHGSAEEYVLMSSAGLTPMQILASLKTALAGDPAQDPADFAKVRYTIRNGKIIYQAQSK